MDRAKMMILDFGGQYKQLIARRIREMQVYSEIKPYNIPLDEIRNSGAEGLILTGGPNSVNAADALLPDPRIFELGIPVLGICYGAQVMAKMLGGEVSRPDHSEYGKVEVKVDSSSPLFKDLIPESSAWMSHFDAVTRLPEGFRITAQTPTCPIAAMENQERRLYATQFHPEVRHTPDGDKMLAHFVFDICGMKANWKMDHFVEDQIRKIREQAGNSKVLCAMSGGVDSSVAALMVHKAIGKNLTCVFVDHGFMRKDEGDSVEQIFRRQFDVNLIRINAQDRFMARLKGITDPEQKRKIIAEEFIRIFEEQASAFADCDYLVQGTIYPDVIESGIGGAVIKSHHNVGGLPEDIKFKGLIEPLRDLFKDEVRKAGLELGLPEDMVWRQPFPGPGLAIRVIGELTSEKLHILREADAIFREEVKKAKLYKDIGQYFTVLTNMRSVGVRGDERTYDYTLALRAVTTGDFMTADWARLPYELLAQCSSRIINEVPGIGRVVYDITAKPPATIEWE